MAVSTYKLSDMILEDYMADGGLIVGARLPSTKELATRYGASCPTVTKALRMLAEKGWVHARRGGGVYVTAFPGRGSSRRLQPEKRIGCILPDLRATLKHQVLEGVELVARREGFAVEVAVSGWDIDVEKRMLGAMRERGVQGAVLYPTVQRFAEPSYLAAELQDFPIVVVDLYQPGMKRPHVIFDNVQAGKAITRFLLGAGRREIALLKFQDSIAYRSVDDRLLGYRRALAEANEQFVPERVIPFKCKGPSSREFHEALECLLELKPRPTAMIAPNDQHAEAAIAWLRQKGLKVPEDIMAAGFDNLQHEPWNERFLTTQPDFVALGERATEGLLERIRSRDMVATGLILPCPLVPPEASVPPNNEEMTVSQEDTPKQTNPVAV